MQILESPNKKITVTGNETIKMNFPAEWKSPDAGDTAHFGINIIHNNSKAEDGSILGNIGNISVSGNWHVSGIIPITWTKNNHKLVFSLSEDKTYEFEIWW